MARPGDVRSDLSDANLESDTMVERIPLLDANDPRIDEPTRELVQGLHDVGAEFNVIRALANHPKLLDGFMQLSAVAYWGSTVPARLAELAYLTTSTENRCHY
jgi:alkylhydroperoxidase family enzyme